MRRGTAPAAAVAAGVALAWAGLVERRWYALRHVTVPVLRAGAGQPLRVLLVSDLHLLPGQDDKVAFVRSCLREGPDLVVGTGDFLGHPAAVAPAVAALGDLARGRPALAVLGSNDFFASRPKNPARYLLPRSRRVLGQRLDTPALVAGLTGDGWQLLDNQTALIESPAGPIGIAGLGDPHVAFDRPERVDWEVGRDDAVLRLGLVHAPYRRSLNHFDQHAFDLVLAGHTHGGQLRVPGFGALTTNCDLPLRQARGLSQWRSTWLYVSAGLGTSMYAPVRFACRPEATILDLVHAGPSSAPADGQPGSQRPDTPADRR